MNFQIQRAKKAKPFDLEIEHLKNLNDHSCYGKTIALRHKNEFRPNQPKNSDKMITDAMTIKL